MHLLNASGFLQFFNGIVSPEKKTSLVLTVAYRDEPHEEH